jgi:hypothetical protein
MRIETRNKIHFNQQLETNKLSYYMRNMQVRSISSKPLTNINIYKQVYNDIKSNPGYMTKGSDGNTLDGMSIKMLEKLAMEVAT